MIIQFATSASVPQLTADDRLAGDALGARGVSMEPVVWSESGSGSGRKADAIIIRSCWDYHLHEREFRTWLAELERQRVIVVNAPGLVRWNMHKKYLAELHGHGIPIVPTFCVESSDERSLRDILDATGWSDAVVKPAVSASAHETWRVHEREATAYEGRFTRLRSAGDVLVQAFMPEITTVGEWSLIFFGSEFSHAVRKLPRAGDFRVQVEHGGSDSNETPPPALIDGAADVLRNLPHAPVYTRVDGVVVDGVFMLMEVECIDPVLYFLMHPPAAARFADEVIRHVTAAG